MTNLYNQRPTWLELAHLELDRAVLAAYGWPEEWAEKLQPNRDPAGKVNPILGVADPATEQETLGRLLTLNLGMAGGDRGAKAARTRPANAARDDESGDGAGKLRRKKKTPG